MKKDWLDSIRERMDGYESSVPDGLWEEIESSVFSERKTRTRVLAPWVWSLAAAAAVALGIFAGIRRIERNDKPDNIAETQEDRASTPIKIQTSSSADKDGSPDSSAGPVHVVPSGSGSLISMAAAPVGETVVTGIAEPAGKVVEPVNRAVESEIEAVVPEEVTAAPVREEDVSVPDMAEPAGDKGFKTDHDGEDWSSYRSATDEGGYRIPSAGISLSTASHEMADITTVDTKVFYLGAAKLDPDMSSGRVVRSILHGNRQTDKYSASEVNKTESDPVTKDDEHRRPIRASLTFLYPINDVLGIETGATYSLLRSSFSTSSGLRVSDVSQSLGYVGVPLNLRVNLLDRDRFSVYASGGGMLEKCVKAAQRTKVLLNDVVSEDYSRNFKVKPLQWSVNAAAGLQMDVAGNFGIYAEPGISYHFDNHSNVSSIYTDRPLDFILTFGARYSFK